MSENIVHFTGYKIRVKGSGVLRSTIKGLDDVVTSTFATLTMSSAPGIEPTRLCNFKNQRARIRFETTAIDETFEVGRIIVYVKTLWTSFPG